jgi:acetyl-CoA carboxylase biotin carboxyl carrier protein
MALRNPASKDPRVEPTTDEIKDLIRLVHETGVEKFELRLGDFELRIIGKRPPKSVYAPPTVIAQPMGSPVAATPPSSPEVHVAPVSAPAPAAAPAPADDDARCKKVTSPMVGTFYRAASPTAPPFAQVGDRVDEDTVLCIIEAMKLMNEIKAETKGVVKKILVENAQPVEYGQPIFLIEPA